LQSSCGDSTSKYTNNDGYCKGNRLSSKTRETKENALMMVKATEEFERGFTNE